MTSVQGIPLWFYFTIAMWFSMNMWLIITLSLRLARVERALKRCIYMPEEKNNE